MAATGTVVSSFVRSLGRQNNNFTAFKGKRGHGFEIIDGVMTLLTAQLSLVITLSRLHMLI